MHLASFLLAHSETVALLSDLAHTKEAQPHE
jgi:hypothetical protein